MTVRSPGSVASPKRSRLCSPRWTPPARVFRGGLVPTEAELTHAEGRDYEPASLLLERVQAARTSLSSGGRSRKRTSRPAATRAVCGGVSA